MTDKKIIQKIVVAGAVLHNGKILILQRHANESVYPNMWELPSGKREAMETSGDALLREVREEAGIDVTVVMPFSVFEYQIEKPDEIRDTTQINFLVRPVGDFVEVTLSSEHQKYQWITSSEASDYGVTEETGNVIRKAFETAELLERK